MDLLVIISENKSHVYIKYFNRFMWNKTIRIKTLLQVLLTMI